MYSVIIVDDHPLLLRGLQDLMSAAPEFEVVGATTSGTEAVSLICDLQPDIAVLDVAIPSMGGLEILRATRNKRLTKFIFLTATISGPQIADALKMGLSGILLKEYAPEELLNCMRKVANGGKWLPQELLSRASMPSDEGMVEKLNLLTARERQITVLICSGLSNRTIAERIGTSEGTVGIHLHNIFRKLEISNRTALAALHVQYMTANNKNV
ncbi:DNA-binding NarL/FixJ family response regulator [Sinorhizobium fredii]|uniref:Nitrate/nitrite response regulator protein NarP n=1 Tax=Sinorhizobium fredii (strain USDA 257) TaxID=1185652 RepID=I3X5W4_SINF2|nr:response regulator transcription factor [Sinorhizobium fredii]AFL51270.1 nitrate/nitrite response regulator protein NarP [Sinorhizobium fredii USDA 257]